MFSAQVATVLIASPSDVTAERDAIEQTIREWNALNAEAYGVILLPFRWESDTYPALNGRPQGLVNQQIGDSCDVLVGCFWTRLGSPTGVEPSGTVEEINRAHDRGRPVLLYFSRMPAALANVDVEQLQALNNFRKECEAKGLTGGFDNHDELRRRLMSDLTRLVREGLLGTGEARGSSSGRASAANQLQETRAAFAGLVSQVETIWQVDGNANYPDVEQWRDLALQLSNKLSLVVAHLVDEVGIESDAALIQDLRQLFKQARELSQHRFYLDGGRSVTSFIEAMNGLIATARLILGTEWSNYDTSRISAKDAEVPDRLA